jgi:hypothetical protein
MDAKRLLTGTVVGGIVITVLGFLLYEVILAGFFDAQMMVATRAAPIWWAAIASALVHGALVTLVLGWAGAGSAAAGLKTGALLGVLVWLGADLILYGVFEFSTLTGALADAALSALVWGAAGAGVGALAGKEGAKAGAPAAA